MKQRHGTVGGVDAAGRAREEEGVTNSDGRRVIHRGNGDGDVGCEREASGKCGDGEDGSRWC